MRIVVRSSHHVSAAAPSLCEGLLTLFPCSTVGSSAQEFSMKFWVPPTGGSSLLAAQTWVPSMGCSSLGTKQSDSHSGENGEGVALRLKRKPNGENIKKSSPNCKMWKYIWKWEYLKTLSIYEKKCKIKV